MLRLSLPNIGDDGVEAVARVLRSGQLVHGQEGELFEAELAAYVGSREAVVVSSGTAALHLSLAALGIGPGDAVLVPDFTFPATANAVRLLGARPVLVDVEAGSYSVSADQLAEAADAWQGPEVLRAVMPVHEFGYPVDMAPVMAMARDRNLFVVEDAACALGARCGDRKAGAWGDLGCFSFHPRKTLTTGEGGAVVTDNPELAARLRLLRNHGMRRGPSGMDFLEPGYNYRLTNFQSALGRTQLASLPGWLERRRELADVYLDLLAPLAAAGRLSLPTTVSGHSWQTFMVVLRDGLERARVIEQLRDQGIEANLGAQCLSALGIYGALAGRRAGAPVAPVLFAQGLALPFCEQLGEDDLARVAHALSKAG